MSNRGPGRQSQSRFQKLCTRVRALGGELRDIDKRLVDGKIINYELLSPGVIAQRTITLCTTLREIEQAIEGWVVQERKSA
jgi:hypothetical protein